MPFWKSVRLDFVGNPAPPRVSALWQEAMDMIAERPNQR